MKPALTLRHVFEAGSLILTLLALICAFALVYYPTQLRLEVGGIDEVSRGIYASSQVTESVLRFGRSDTLPTRNRAERDLIAAIQNLRKNAATKELLRHVRQLENDVNQYIAAGKRLNPAASPPPGTAVLNGLKNVNQALSTQAMRINERAVRIDRQADVMGFILGSLFIAGFIGVIVITGNYLLRPLAKLRITLAHFARGEFSERAEVAGAWEIREIANTCNAMADDLKEQERRRFEFLAGVAHDLRNPLAALKMASDLVARECAQSTNSRAIPATQVIGRQITRLNRMVLDLIDATRTQSGQLKLAMGTYDLREIVRDSADLWRNTSSKHEIVTRLPSSPIMVYCDADRIGQVLNNLLSNAIKYSPGGGTVLLAASVRADRTVVLSVTDHGIGISTDDLSQVFRPFHRTGIAQAEKIPGVGLGLAVTKKLVEGHGGSISVESTVGLGSTFNVQLPLATDSYDARAHLA